MIDKRNVLSYNEIQMGRRRCSERSYVEFLAENIA